jgi:hypothetical protein
MMTLERANGTRITKAGASAVYTTPPVTDPIIKISEDLYRQERPDGTRFPAKRRVLAFRAGELVPKSRLDAEFPDATIDKISPATGAAAGGTAITLTGTNYTPGATVTVGGAAATNVTVVSEKKITCTTPAGTAGARDVVVTTDAGTVTKTGGFTYA